ncbi:MAG: hypothetical protein ACREUF_06435, partial [Solimonas sp.]
MICCTPSVWASILSWTSFWAVICYAAPVEKMLKSLSFWCLFVFCAGLSLSDGDPWLTVMVQASIAAPLIWWTGWGLAQLLLKPAQTWRWATRLEGASHGEALVAILVFGLIGLGGGGLQAFTLLAVIVVPIAVLAWL